MSSVHHLQQATVDARKARSDLVHVASILGLPRHSQVRLVSRCKLQVVMDCGTPTVQVMHSSESFYGGPGYDAVLVCVEESASEALSMGLVRAVLRKEHGDVAILSQLEELDAEPGCPLNEKGCVRLGWRAVPGASRIAHRVIPVCSIRRLLLLMPEFAEISACRRAAAVPVGGDRELGERLKERFFINDFHPWYVTGRP